jgi:type I restriction enzyme, S subunit
MEVSNGYKQTEVGSIPKDWDVDEIKNLALITTGAKNTQDKIEDGAYPFFVRSQNVERINTYSFNGEAVLTAGDGVGTGKVFHYINGKFDFHQRVYKVSDFKRDVLDGYFFYLYFSNHFYDRIMSMTAKSSVDSVRMDVIAGMKMPLPPLPEQRAIAAAISDVGALLSSLDALIAKKRLIKQGAMQELLHPKDDWVEKKLRDTAILKARIGWQGLTTAEYLDSGEYYLVTGTDFRGGYIDWENCHYVDEWRYKQDKNIQLREHDVLVTKDGTIGKVALITHLERPATLNSGVFVIRPIDNAFYPDFFYYLLNSKVFFEFLSQLSAGSTINHLYQKDFVNFAYKTPPTIKEQTAIAEILGDMDTEIAALEKKREKTRLLKQGMMQELLTGRIRLV